MDQGWIGSPVPCPSENTSDSEADADLALAILDRMPRWCGTEPRWPPDVFALVLWLGCYDSATVGDVGRCLELSAASASGLVQRARECGAVRTAKGADARLTIVRLTPKAAQRMRSSRGALRGAA